MTLNDNKRLTAGIFILIFLLLLLCNFLTEEIADDYSYHFSWSTGKWIESVADIIPSMRIHAHSTNGRVVAHFFVQLFEMLPKWIFNVINSLLFALMIGLMHYIASGNKRNNGLLLGLFGAVWIFTPAFGQVYLWLDGACNYLWGVAAGLLWLIPWIKDFLYDKPLKTWWMKLSMVLLSVPVGAFSENGSAAFIGMSVLLQMAMVIFQKKKPTLWGIASVAAACGGYLPMVFAPGTLKNKGGNFGLGFLRENFITAMEKYRMLEILLIALCVMLVLCVVQKVRREKLILALIFVAGSLAANFMMTAAAYYPDRSMVFCTVLLIVADGILLEELMSGDYQVTAACALSVVMLYTAFFVLIGVNDIFYTGSHMKENEQYIAACREEGIMDVKVPLFRSETKYSASTGLLYLSTERSDVWPNTSMAKFFEVDSIIGYWKQD